jgi:uncharacterized protein YidB (DUF937 family)
MATPDVLGALKGLRDLLAGQAGIRASIDPATLSGQLPAAWVTVQEIPADAWTLTGPSHLTAWVYLVAANTGVPEALDQLTKLLGQVLQVLTPDGAVNTATSVVLPNVATPLPAFMVPVALDL